MRLMSSKGITSLSALYKDEKIGFLRKRYAGELRQSDYMVKIDHPDLSRVVRTRRQSSDENTSRERSLSIAIGDYCPGQITSYRSTYFIVNNIETDQGISAKIRESVYQQRTSGGRDEDL
jgi:hypothetical protein